MENNRLNHMVAMSFRIMAGLLVGLTLTACPPKNKGTSAATPGGWVPGFPQGTLGVAGNELVRSISRRPVGAQEVELGLRLFAGTATPPGFPIEGYVGPVSASGYLEVRTANWGGCTVVPLGRYEIRTSVPNGRFSPDHLSFPWNLSALHLDLVHSSGFVAKLLVDYAEFRNLAQSPVHGLDGLPYFHTMYGQTILSTPIPAAGCYFGPVVLFFPWSM